MKHVGFSRMSDGETLVTTTEGKWIKSYNLITYPDRQTLIRRGYINGMYTSAPPFCFDYGFES